MLPCTAGTGRHRQPSVIQRRVQRRISGEESDLRHAAAEFGKVLALLIPYWDSQAAQAG
jgi:hypothetical protein